MQDTREADAVCATAQEQLSTAVRSTALLLYTRYTISKTSTWYQVPGANQAQAHRQQLLRI